MEDPTAAPAGSAGLLEKTLVLAFCDELKRQLESTKRYTVVMTRDSDQYVDLDERVNIARQANASLVRLDSRRHPQRSTRTSAGPPSTPSPTARPTQRRLGSRRAKTPPTGEQGKEKRAQQDPGVADILFDLKRRETRIYAHMFSRGLVDRLARRDQTQPQSGAVGGLCRSQSPGISFGAGRTRLSLERPGRPGAELAGVAGQDGLGNGRRDRCVLRRFGRGGACGRGFRRRARTAGRRTFRPLTLARRDHFALSAGFARLSPPSAS